MSTITNFLNCTDMFIDETNGFTFQIHIGCIVDYLVNVSSRVNRFSGTTTDNKHEKGDGTDKS